MCTLCVAFTRPHAGLKWAAAMKGSQASMGTSQGSRPTQAFSNAPHIFSQLYLENRQQCCLVSGMWIGLILVEKDQIQRQALFTRFTDTPDSCHLTKGNKTFISCLNIKKNYFK